MRSLLKSFTILLIILLIGCKNANDPNADDLSKNKVTITAGNLHTKFSKSQLDTITTITLKGTIDARDFRIMRDSMPKLSKVDLSAISVVGYTGGEGTIGTNPTVYTYNPNWIPEGAFCKSDLSTGKTSLTEIKLPLNIDTIGGYSFALSSNLKSLYIPSTVKYLVYKAFWKSSSAITVDQNNQYFSSIDGVLFSKDLSVLLFYPGSKIGSYSIPASVIGIGNYAFSNCTNLTSVTLPSTLAYLNMGAFEYCTGLKSITFPTSLINIWNGAFSGCKGLTSLTIPSTTTVYGGAFSNCTGLLSANYPNPPYSQAGIFNGCTSLNSVTFNSGVTTIKASSFKNCTGLSSINIPEGVTLIEGNAFENCSSLNTLKLPTTIQRIMYRGFFGCSNLSTIYAYSPSPTDIIVNNIDVFTSVNTNSCILYVPKGYANSYSNYWRIFKNIVEMN
jgi:hypothetical protein